MGQSSAQRRCQAHDIRIDRSGVLLKSLLYFCFEQDKTNDALDINPSEAYIEDAGSSIMWGNKIFSSHSYHL